MTRAAAPLARTPTRPASSGPASPAHEHPGIAATAPAPTIATTTLATS